MDILTKEYTHTREVLKNSTSYPSRIHSCRKKKKKRRKRIQGLELLEEAAASRRQAVPLHLEEAGTSEEARERLTKQDEPNS